MKRWFLAGITAAGALLADDPNLLRNSYHPAVKDGMNVWIDVDILYWRPWEKALVATNKKSDVFTTDNFTEAAVVHPDFKWDLGYRVSGGYLFSSNLWDVEGSWTHFTSDVSEHRSSHGSAFVGMFPIWSLSDDVIAGDYVFESSLKWKFTVNMLDVQFSRYLRTLVPTALTLNLPIHSPYGPGQEQQLVQLIFNEPLFDGKNILICWHHTFIAALIEAFGYTPPAGILPSYPNRFDLVWVMTFPAPNPPVVVNPILQELLFGDPTTFP